MLALLCKETIMGQFRIEISAVAGHGCSRTENDGDSIKHSGCQRMNCPDCLARSLVQTFQRLGFHDLKATFTHWPDTDAQVVDDLVAGVRHGSFT